MRIWGKLFGVFFGFMFGHLFGALLGLWLGHKFDQALGQDFNISDGLLGGVGNAGKRRQERFFFATFSVMGHIAKAKGRVTEAEIQIAQALMSRMQLDTEAKSQAQRAFSEGKGGEFPLEQVVSDFARRSRGRRDVLQMFLEIQLQAAFADGELHPNEKDVLLKVADSLGFSHTEFERLLQMLEAEFSFHQQKAGATSASRLKDAHQLIGVDESDSDQAVKRAYRKLMNQHHPDKLVSKGLPPEMLQVAKEKAQDIQKAYEVIRKSRGFK